jgi:hypothetical protein
VKGTVIGVAVFALLLCCAPTASADAVKGGGPARPLASAHMTATSAAEATNARARTVPGDPPAWRSVAAVLLGAALVAGVAIGTGLLGRESDPEDPPGDRER